MVLKLFELGCRLELRTACGVHGNHLGRVIPENCAPKRCKIQESEKRIPVAFHLASRNDSVNFMRYLILWNEAMTADS